MSRREVRSISLQGYLNYPKDHFQYSKNNKKYLGKMKDELHSLIITNFIGLRSKMYCLKILIKPDIIKSKGLKSNIAKLELNYDLSYERLFENLLNNETQNNPWII